MISRIVIFLYSLACYAAGFVALVYAIGFVGDFLVPDTIDSGVTPDMATAFAYDLPLLGLFAVQHSVMARQWFKRVWTQIVPKAAERATYVLFAAICLFLLYGLWKPMPGTIWNVTDHNAALAITGVYFLGWGIVFLSTFLISHFELMGLQQSFAHLRGRKPTPPKFKTPLLYKVVRHPIYMGLLMAFWATPHMTQGHLLFALATTGYIFIGIALEERDLISFFGNAYREYRQAVPMVIPLLGLSRRTRKSPDAGKGV